MLAQGLLHWQHLYIPVLPPHLWQYLAAPYPYLIGILSSNLAKLDRTDGLGEVLMIHLDSNTMETRGMDQDKVQKRLPDLFRNLDVNQQGGAASASELLAQDLIELLKTDKRTLYGESTFANVSEKAAKAGKAVKNTFFKLRDKGREFLQNRSGSDVGLPTPEESFIEDDPDAKSLSADYIYTEGCHSEAGEEEARIAFTTFFLCMFGNMKWYVSMGQNQTPVLDRNRFLQQKRSMGEGEGTPIWPLLQNFCQTQMLEEFANARIEEVRTRQPVTPDTSLFLQCVHYLRQHNIDFGVLSVRRITRQVAQGNPSRLAGMMQTNARRTAMTLTSNKGFEGDYSRAIAGLVEECRESSSVLFDVMSVIWLRLRDSRGMQWKHGYHALQILKNLLYHGPLAAVAEATDGLDKIRSMKFYDHMRYQTAQEVRTAAGLVYNLLVDRAKLFHIRRVCAERRRTLQDRNQPRVSVSVFNALNELCVFDFLRFIRLFSAACAGYSVETQPSFQEYPCWCEPSRSRNNCSNSTCSSNSRSTDNAAGSGTGARFFWILSASADCSFATSSCGKGHAWFVRQYVGLFKHGGSGSVSAYSESI